MLLSLVFVGAQIVSRPFRKPASRNQGPATTVWQIAADAWGAAGSRRRQRILPLATARRHGHRRRQWQAALES
jgi:hypothetical protein